MSAIMMCIEKNTDGMTRSSNGVWDLLPATSIPSEIFSFIKQVMFQIYKSHGISYSQLDFNYDMQNSVVLNGYRGHDKILRIPTYIDGKLVIGLTRYALYKDCLQWKDRDEDGHWDGEYYYERVPSVEFSEIILPDHIYYLDDFVFSDIPTLSRVSLPQSLLHMGHSCFEKSGIQQIELPQNIFDVPSDCFYECINLSKVTLGDYVQTIKNGAFDGCILLKNIDLPQSLTQIQGSAFARSGLTHINLPSGLKTIHIHAFANCFDLEYCCIPRSVNHIDDHSFSWYVEKMNSEGRHRYENVNNPTTTLFVYPGSYAHMWAVQHGHKVASAEL